MSPTQRFWAGMALCFSAASAALLWLPAYVLFGPRWSAVLLALTIGAALYLIVSGLSDEITEALADERRKVGP